MYVRCFFRCPRARGLSSNLFAMSSRKSSLVSLIVSLVRCFVCCFVRVRDNSDSWNFPLLHRSLNFSRYLTSSSFQIWFFATFVTFILFLLFCCFFNFFFMLFLLQFSTLRFFLPLFSVLLFLFLHTVCSPVTRFNCARWAFFREFASKIFPPFFAARSRSLKRLSTFKNIFTQTHTQSSRGENDQLVINFYHFSFAWWIFFLRGAFFRNLHNNQIYSIYLLLLLTA